MSLMVIFNTFTFQDLLSLCGCQVVATIRNANIVVCNPSLYASVRNRVSQVTLVSEKWVLDCVQHHKIHNMSDYKVIENSAPNASQRMSTAGNLSCAI